MTPTRRHSLYRRTAAAFLVAVMTAMIIPVTSASALSSGQTLYVNTPSHNVLYMRSSASASSKKVAAFPYKAAVIYISRKGAWYRVKAAGYTGYMYSAYLTSSKPGGSSSGSSSSSYGSARTGYVAITGNNTAPLYASASTSSKVLGRYLNGVKVGVTGESGNFYKVVVSGHNGYMEKRYVGVAGTSGGSDGSSSSEGTLRKVTNKHGSTVNLRESAGTGRIIYHIPVGDSVRIVKQNKYWSQVNYYGMTGYIGNEFLQ